MIERMKYCFKTKVEIVKLTSLKARDEESKSVEHRFLQPPAPPPKLPFIKVFKKYHFSRKPNPPVNATSCGVKIIGK